MQTPQGKDDFELRYDSSPWLPHYAQGVRKTLDALPFQSIPDMVERTCLRFGNKTAYTVSLDNGLEASLTFTEVMQFSEAFAAFLRHDLGLAKGDRVAVQLPNCLSYPVVAFGVFMAGGVLVNTNPLYTAFEMEHQFKDSGAKILVILDMFADKLEAVIKKTDIHTIVRVSVADLFPLPKRQLIKLVLKVKRKIPATNVKTVPFYLALATGLMHTASCHSLLPSFLQAKRTNIESKTRFWEDLHEHDIAALQYTGGTTGVSKGAMLTHGSLLANMMQILAFGDKFIEPGCEKVLTALPLYHIFAFTVNNLVLFYMGATNVLIPSPRPITNLRKAFEKHDFTWVSGVNTLFNALCHEKWFSDNPPRHLKMSIAGGAPLLKSVADKWESITGTPVIEGYGLTEASPVLTFNPIGGQVKEGSIGVPMPDTRIRIVNDEGICVKPGEPGELIANGPQMMAGYWNRPQETEKTLKEGWLYTGDVAVMDEEGYFKIVDRKKDMILVSGFNVYPNEVEAILSLHPDVLEVAVIGIPDEKSGEVVKAFVVRKSDSLTESQLKEHCKEMMTSYKIPRAFEFRKELPKSPIGKILRKELRDVKKA